jgi:hypothetical protein
VGTGDGTGAGVGAGRIVSLGVSTGAGAGTGVGRDAGVVGAGVDVGEGVQCDGESVGKAGWEVRGKVDRGSGRGWVRRSNELRHGHRRGRRHRR